MSEDKKLITSAELHAEWTEEREKKGLKAMPAINPGKGSTNTLARMDKS